MRAAANDASMDFERMQSAMQMLEANDDESAKKPEILIVDDEMLNIEVLGLLLLG